MKTYLKISSPAWELGEAHLPCSSFGQRSSHCPQRDLRSGAALHGHPSSHRKHPFFLCPSSLPGISSALLGPVLASPTHVLPGRCAAPVGALLSLPSAHVSGRRVASEDREWTSLPTAVLCSRPQELLHYLIGTLLLLVASIVGASKSYSQSELVAAAVRISLGSLRR